MKRPMARATSEASGLLRPSMPDRGASAGGGYTSATDLLRLVAALGLHRLLDAAHPRTCPRQAEAAFLLVEKHLKVAGAA